MSQRLKDLRLSIQTIDAADAAFGRIAQCEIYLTEAEAQLESKIAALKAVYEKITAPCRTERDELVKDLAAYVEGHRMEFKKPRRRKTKWGTYGLTDATKAKIDNKDDAILYCVSKGWTDCIKTTLTLLSKPLRDRLQAGETCEGARLISGDVAGYTVKKELLDSARHSTHDTGH